MAFQVYRKEKGSESVEPIGKDVFKTREEAEIALNEAKNELQAEPNILDLDPLFDPEPTDENVADERIMQENNVEFFIREI